ncbi:MAG: hypothetical protein IPH97_10325 [Ignavibacteriales bacterium]|nr:hypothetical protein [Ignavibacteriales bacterium]
MIYQYRILTAILNNRSEFCLWVLNNSDDKIDSYQYSDSGYVVAAAMVERLSQNVVGRFNDIKIFSH